MGLLCALSLSNQHGARADSDVKLFVDRSLGDALVSALRPVGGRGDAQLAGGNDAACAAQPAGTARLAVLARQPRPPEIETCQRQAGADVVTLTIGYQAVALVAPANAPVFPLQSSDLFRAVARNGGGSRAPAVWRDVDATLPALQVGFLAPPAGSSASRLLNSYVMEPACDQTRGGRMPFERANRAEFCSALRGDPGIKERRGGGQEVADWAASAPAGQVAVISVAELRALDQVVLPLPLDGVLPTAANVETGRYPAAEKISLLIVVPADALPARRDAARQAVFDLLAERSIGPEGSLTTAGLIPLPPAERVAARARAMAFVEHP
jgi:phosphate transport system substrate-binding protein